MVPRLALAVVGTVSLLSLDVSAQRRGGFGDYGGYGGITVYEHPDFRGSSLSFRDEIPDLREHGLNDRITSLEVDGNQAWEVCRDINFAGGCRVFTGSIDDLRQEGWNDRISSLRPVGFADHGRGNGRGIARGRDRRHRSQSRLVIYDRPNYRGDAREILNSATNLGRIGERARSVEVYGGTWELCEGAVRHARCVTINQSVPDLRTLGLRNGIDSVRETVGQTRGRWFD
ncbi:MAG TPA: beta/gamma crystallin-related protein [Vicinamibacterales bacterium]|nr:beta/gamma crystallin-related protein [Vicinamibacterales bacterium]